MMTSPMPNLQRGGVGGRGRGDNSKKETELADKKTPFKAKKGMY